MAGILGTSFDYSVEVDNYTYNYDEDDPQNAGKCLLKTNNLDEAIELCKQNLHYHNVFIMGPKGIMFLKLEGNVVETPTWPSL